MPEVNGTTYGDCPPEVIAVLERCRADRTRIRVAYGYPADGQDWGEPLRNSRLRESIMWPDQNPLACA